MRILKLFSKFMTNHSSAAYQVIIIAVRKEYQIEDLIDDYYNFKLVSGEKIEKMEDDYKLELESLLDRYNIYESWSASMDEHGFFEDGGSESYDDIMDYWQNWLAKAQRKVNKIKKMDENKITLLYFNQDID